MSTDGIVGGTQAVIWAPWYATIRVGITVFTCSVGVGWRVAHIVLAVSVCSAGKTFTPLAVTAFISTRAVAVLFTLWDTLPSNTGLPW